MSQPRAFVVVAMLVCVGFGAWSYGIGDVGDGDVGDGDDGGRTQFTRSSLEEAERVYWSRVASSFSDHMVVWVKKEMQMEPAVLEQQLRVERGVPVTFLRPLFGKGVWLFKCDLGQPKEEGPFTVAMLKQMVEIIRGHPSVRECRVDLVPASETQQDDAGVVADRMRAVESMADATQKRPQIREEL